MLRTYKQIVEERLEALKGQLAREEKAETCTKPNYLWVETVKDILMGIYTCERELIVCKDPRIGGKTAEREEVAHSRRREMKVVD